MSSIFMKVCVISMRILRKKNFEEQPELFDFIGDVKNGECLNVWTLLNNKTITSCYTCVAAQKTTVYYFRRDQFFEALEIGLSSSRPMILEFIKKLPIFEAMSSSVILSNIGKFEKVILKYGDKISKTGDKASHAYILMEGNLSVKKTVPYTQVSSISRNLIIQADQKFRKINRTV